MQCLRDCYWIKNAKICGKIGHRLKSKNVQNVKIITKKNTVLCEKNQLNKVLTHSPWTISFENTI